MRQSDALILTDGPSNEEESKGKSLSATTGAKKAQKKDKSKGATSSSKRAKSLAVASLPSSPSSTSTSKKKLIGLLVLEPKSDSVVVTSKSVSDKVLESMLQLIASSTVKLPAMVVGRNSKQNERVTFEVAKEHHIWFHVQGSPGSHCVLLLEQNQRADDASIQFAADVASYFSQSRDSTQVAVAYCSPKHLRRPQGIRKLGLVTMSQQLGTVYGRPARGEVYAELFGPKDYKES